MSSIKPELSLERMRQTRETLTAAFGMTIRGEFSGAIEARDPAGCFSEAKRNITALIGVLHGQKAWKDTLDGD